MESVSRGSPRWSCVRRRVLSLQCGAPSSFCALWHGSSSPLPSSSSSCRVVALGASALYRRSAAL
eukprot:1951629-Pyramimonas_sp.AAC.1